MSLKDRIADDMKSAMRARDKDRLSVIRMIMAAIKQREVDDRVDLDEAGVTAVIEKMIKQRRESLSQYRDAGRDDLADGEAAELEVLEAYLPEQLAESEVAAIIDAVLAETGAASMKDMGAVMGVLKPKLQGRADMAAASALVKQRLAG